MFTGTQDGGTHTGIFDANIDVNFSRPASTSSRLTTEADKNSSTLLLDRIKLIQRFK